ncbi:hypothetical protein TrLO_g11314 [Triparma laevis f. longispina]|uniref:Cyclic nucleotide-binding domain-containing protein n=1 Tax=Triparma laevis f. longispina TaxID=1714387 RepID=A0A9W6ZUI0_9STRA|nr:hypothetical protein TrLO_g11314 [Triparma laevis f. longispina]
MQVSYKERTTSFLLDPNTGYDVDPSSSFEKERVYYQKKLKPFVDTNVPISKFTEGKKRVKKRKKLKKIKRRGSLIEDSDDDDLKKLEKMEEDGTGMDASMRRMTTLERSPKSGKRRAIIKVNQNNKKPHQVRRLQLPVLLSSDFKELPNLSPQQTQDINISHGLRDYASGEHKLALKKFTRAAEQDSSNFLPWFVRGLCYAKLNKWDSAVKDFTKCCNISKADLTDRTAHTAALAFFNRGVARSRCLKFGDAIKDFSEAIILNKGEEDYYKNRALLYRRNGDYQLAQKDYQVMRTMNEKASADSHSKTKQNALSEEISFVDSSPHSPDKMSTSLSDLGGLMSGQSAKSRKRRTSSMISSGVGRRESNASPTVHSPSPDAEGMMNMSLGSGGGDVTLPKIGGANQPNPSAISPAFKRGMERREKEQEKADGGRQKRNSLIDSGKRTSLNEKQEAPIGNGLTPMTKKKIQERKLKEKIYGLVYTALVTPPHERTPGQLELLTTESSLMPAFGHLTRDQLKLLWNFLTYRKFVPNHRLFEHGDEADKFYVIWGGQVTARIETSVNPVMGASKMSPFLRRNSGMVTELTVGTINVGEALGEAAATGGLRKAACVTECVTELLVLNKHGFQKTFKKFFEDKDRDKRTFLRNLSFFKPFNEDELLKEAHFCREVEYRAGDTIVKQGDDADCIFFIMSGLVNAIRNLNDVNDDGETTLCSVMLTKLCTGEFFGENAILNNEIYPYYPSTIECETTVRLLKLEKSQMNLSLWESEKVLELLKDAAYKYPDDNVLLQTHVDIMRSRQRKRRVMKDLNTTMKRRGRKDESVVT